MGGFGYKKAKFRPNKDCGHDPENRKKFNRQKDNNDIVNSAADEIILQENQKVSTEKRTHKNTKSDFYESKLYQINNMSLDDTKKT